MCFSISYDIRSSPGAEFFLQLFNASNISCISNSQFIFSLSTVEVLCESSSSACICFSTSALRVLKLFVKFSSELTAANLLPNSSALSIFVSYVMPFSLIVSIPRLLRTPLILFTILQTFDIFVVLSSVEQ